MDIKRQAKDTEEYIIEQRRYFHKHPELSWEEIQTTLRIEEELKKMGLNPIRYENLPGLYTMIEGGKAGKNAKTILLRADIDALPVVEKTGLEFASEVNGVMHACGHDCHIAMMLGTAKILNDIKGELEGNVKIFFQAAEETASGAPEYIKCGILDGVDAVYGAHVYGGLEVPYIDITPGPRMASADQIDIEIFGEPTHASAPHTGNDALVAANAVITALQAYVSRMNDPLNPLVITIGTIQGGQRRNIVPGYVKMEGTVRTHFVETRNEMENRLRKIIGKTAEAYGCEAKVAYRYMMPAVRNDEQMTFIARRAAEKLFGEEVPVQMPLVMASEDFAHLVKDLPGIYVNIGSANKKLGYTHTNHNECYTVDESILQRGAALCAQVAVDYLSMKKCEEQF